MNSFVGEQVNGFTARCSSGNDNYGFETAAGRYMVLNFFKDGQKPEAKKFIEWVLNNPLFDDVKAAYFGVSENPLDEDLLPRKEKGVRYFWDPEAEIRKTVVGNKKQIPECLSLVIDPMLRVMAEFELRDADTHIKQLESFLNILPPTNLFAGVATHAPVLIVPRIFEPAFCRELIGTYQRIGGQESGFMRDKDGKTVGIVDYKFKRREDVYLDAGDEFKTLRETIQRRIFHRLLPQIRKAFNFDATCMERYLIAEYDSAKGGYFMPHRDNTTLATKHRKFAVTINLNAEEFEGGNLRFPEFGDHTYRAPTGGAVIFSCSLLHEATPVRKGRRYAFLPFLYDAASSKVRDEGRRYLEGSNNGVPGRDGEKEIAAHGINGAAPGNNTNGSQLSSKLKPLFS